uniref:Transmembrane protein 192 n=1 Tax=Callorhinchus milii TaxID=7868 RepID=V9L6L2_CALMI
MTPPRQQNSSFDVTQSLEEEPLIDHPLLHADVLVGDLRPYFQSLSTVWWSVLLTILHVVFVALSFTLAFVCNPSTAACEKVILLEVPKIIIMAKTCLWALLALFGWYVHAQHSKVRNRGYLALYRSTRHLKHLPIFIHSTGNTALLLVQAAVDNKSLNLNITLGVLAVELFFSSACLIIYTDKIVKFNRTKPYPDIQEEERRHGYPNVTNIVSETGFRDGSSMENLVEKQADLIDYLTMHNVQLSKRLLSLTTQQIRE